MSKFGAPCTKTLVRNTKQRVPKTCISSEPQKKSLEVQTVRKTVEEAVDLGAPSANASRTTIRKIREVENVKQDKARSLSDVDESRRTTIEEKITKQMNFHHDRQIYKDLIPLCVKPTVQPSIQSRQPQPQKDKEPSLTDFATRKPQLDYGYTVPAQARTAKIVREYDGFKTYRITQKW